MPVINEQVTITYKLLPLTLFTDGTASVVVRRGLLHADNSWEALSEKTIIIDNPAIVSSILDVQPVPGLTRRDDLSLAVYNYLVSIGEVSGLVE
jgi:hypothetical protein